MLCPCHPHPAPLLAFRPPAVINRRGRWVLSEHVALPAPASAAQAAGEAAAAGAATPAAAPAGPELQSAWEMLDAESWEAMASFHGGGGGSDGDGGAAASLLRSGLRATLHVSTPAPQAASPACGRGAGGEQEVLDGSGPMDEEGVDGPTMARDGYEEGVIGLDYALVRKKAARGPGAWGPVQGGRGRGAGMGGGGGGGEVLGVGGDDALSKRADAPQCTVWTGGVSGRSLRVWWGVVCRPSCNRLVRNGAGLL
jgi:hypothetical protein